MSQLLQDLFGPQVDPNSDVQITIGPAVLHPDPQVKITMGPAVIERPVYQDLGTLAPLHLEVVEQRPSLLPWALGGIGLFLWKMKR